MGNGGCASRQRTATFPAFKRQLLLWGKIFMIFMRKFHSNNEWKVRDRNMTALDSPVSQITDYGPWVVFWGDLRSGGVFSPSLFAGPERTFLKKARTRPLWRVYQHLHTVFNTAADQTALRSKSFTSLPNISFWNELIPSSKMFDTKENRLILWATLVLHL